jgi:hypothetical protein
MHVKTAEASTGKWIRRSIMAFLEGQRNLKWVVGVIGNCVADAKQMLIDLKTYGDRQRYQ